MKTDARTRDIGSQNDVNHPAVELLIPVGSVEGAASPLNFAADRRYLGLVDAVRTKSGN